MSEGWGKVVRQKIVIFVADTYFGMREDLAGQLENWNTWKMDDTGTKVDLYSEKFLRGP